MSLNMLPCPHKKKFGLFHWKTSATPCVEEASQNLEGTLLQCQGCAFCCSLNLSKFSIEKLQFTHNQYRLIKYLEFNSQTLPAVNSLSPPHFPNKSVDMWSPQNDGAGWLWGPSRTPPCKLFFSCWGTGHQAVTSGKLSPTLTVTAPSQASWRRNGLIVMYMDEKLGVWDYWGMDMLQGTRTEEVSLYLITATLVNGRCALNTLSVIYY